HLFLLAWFAIGLLPGFLSSEAPRVYRILLATPPVFLWAALPLERLWSWARSPAAEVRLGGRITAGALVGLILLLQPLFDFDYYFHRVYSHREYNNTQGTRIVEMARLLRERGPGFTGYLIDEGFGARHDSVAFLARVWSLNIRETASLSELVPLRAEENAVLL